MLPAATRRPGLAYLTFVHQPSSAPMDASGLTPGCLVTKLALRRQARQALHKVTGSAWVLLGRLVRAMYVPGLSSPGASALH
jgi:hypothetical protein